MVQIVTKYDVRSGAVASKHDPDVVYVDPRIPEKYRKYLAIHEVKERHAMLDEGRTYLDAHENVATPAEKQAVEADGLDWNEYTHSIDGYLDEIENSPAPNPPPDPHVNIDDAIGHHRHHQLSKVHAVTKLTKEKRDALPAEDFAVPETREMPIHDDTHAKMAWDMVTRTKGLTPEQRAEARKRILHRAKTLGIDTSDWEKQSISAASMLASMQAMSLNIPTNPHPNKMPFSGILTRIGEPSDAAPEGSGGRRVMITTEAAAKALDSLLGMAVDYQTEFDGHDPKAKIGLITDATIEANAIRIGGYIYAADFPEVAKDIKANKDVLGFSFEARDLFTPNPEADPIPIVDCVFTGAAILLKDKAAYRTTSINAAQDATANSSKDDIVMNDETKKEFAALLADAIKPLAEQVKAHGDQITEMKKAEEMKAANHLAKVEKHASEMEKAADHMDAAGIGGHPTRGHAAILRNMAGDLRASAAQGKMPYAYDAFYANASEVKSGADEQVKKAVELASAEAKKAIDEVKAAAEKAAKEAADKVASLETKITDLKAAADKADLAAKAPDRKTLTVGQNALLAKAGVEIPTDGSKLSIAKLDEVLAKSSISTDKRFELKTALHRIGALD